MWLVLLVISVGCGAEESTNDHEHLSSADIGDSVNGKQVFADKRCADCHSYAGEGGTDATPLDFMTGNLSPRDLANMSGTLWNHLPEMLEHFEAENIPVPVFSGDEMADLIAYLHGGAPGPGMDSAPQGHHGGESLPSSAIGDALRGQELFDEKRCSDCHSYGGMGGVNAAPLDYMSGHLSATEMANMAGTVWNHLPAMLPHFEAEAIPVPKFSGDEMADLIAYLHGGLGE